MLLRNRLTAFQFASLLSPSSSSPSLKIQPFTLSLRNTLSISISGSACRSPSHHIYATKATAARLVRKFLFVPPGVEPQEVTDEMVLPGSNIVVGPYAGDAKIKDVEFVKSSRRAKDCPRDDRPEFAILGRSNVGKSSLINALVRKKEVALTSKKPGKTQLINYFLVNKSWYIVDLPGYGNGSQRVTVDFQLVVCRENSPSLVEKDTYLWWKFAKASEAARTDWSSFTKGYFLNRDTLVAVLLLVDASVPPQKIDLDCANWLGRNNMPLTFVFTKCDKMKGKGKKPDENIRDFQQLIAQNFPKHPPWIMTSSVTGLGRDELLLHMSQLRNYWDQ